MCVCVCVCVYVYVFVKYRVVKILNAKPYYKQWHVYITLTVHFVTYCLDINSITDYIYSTTCQSTTTVFFYEGKSLNNRNFILKCMEKYAQRKILFRDTKWLLSNMSYRGRDDQAV